MKSAFVCLTSTHIVSRSLAFLLSLENTGALENSKCYILCFDEEAYSIIEHNSDSSHIQPLLIKDVLGVEQFKNRPIGQMAFASKPFLMKWAFEHEGVQRVIYLDSDTWFVHNPSFLFDYFEPYDIILIPAVINPEVTIFDWETVARNAQRTGYYNAGFIGCSWRAKEFLDWWADRCTHGTHTDFYRNIYGDQKYLNWVPCLFPNVLILRHNGLNVKSFSTRHACFLRQSNGSAILGADPVIYFHFSQNLGNLLSWPPELHPEVSTYLKEVEMARKICGKPYVDTSVRNNNDLIRPLIAQEGLEFRWVELLRRIRNLEYNLKHLITSLIARTGRFIPLSLRRRLIKRYLRKWWQLNGDVGIDEFDNLHHSLIKKSNCSPCIFFGVSRFAYYLAYLGHKVVIYDPFQGYYNKELNSLFNPQFEKAQKMRKFLYFKSNLSIERVPFTEVRNTEKVKICFISSRLGKEKISEIVKVLSLSPSLKGMVLLFKKGQSREYRELCRTAITTSLNRNSLEKQNGFDLFWLKHEKVSSSSNVL